MDQTFTNLYAFTLFFAESLMRDIDDTELRHQPSPGVNPPAWILGHLAICTDSALKLLGQPPRLPEAWHKGFGRGSDPASPDLPEVTKEELLTALREGHAAVVTALPSASAETLARPSPFKALADSLPTVGDLLGHLLTTHEAMHLGHLSNWRRQRGRPPLF